MRCSNCNKFVSNELADPELNGLEVSLDDEKNAEVTGDVRLTLTCSDCSTELAEATVDVSTTVTLIHENDAKDHEVELESENAEGTDWYDGKGRPARYQRHYYGAMVTGTVTCSCGASSTFEVQVGEQASGFDQL